MFKYTCNRWCLAARFTRSDRSVFPIIYFSHPPAYGIFAVVYKSTRVNLYRHLWPFVCALSVHLYTSCIFKSQPWSSVGRRAARLCSPGSRHTSSDQPLRDSQRFHARRAVAPAYTLVNLSVHMSHFKRHGGGSLVVNWSLWSLPWEKETPMLLHSKPQKGHANMLLFHLCRSETLSQEHCLPIAFDILQKKKKKKKMCLYHE